jgi:hypothetical protein
MELVKSSNSDASITPSIGFIRSLFCLFKTAVESFVQKAQTVLGILLLSGFIDEFVLSPSILTQVCKIVFELGFKTLLVLLPQNFMISSFSNYQPRYSFRHRLKNNHSWSLRILRIRGDYRLSQKLYRNWE